MAKKMISAITSEQKDIYKIFQPLANRYGRFKVWTNFITLTACNLCPTNREKRNKEYESIASQYTVGELRQLADMAAITTIALTKNPEQDFLGSLFAALRLQDTGKAQVFTPYPICKKMASDTFLHMKKTLERQPWISVYDPSCGAGAFPIAFYNELNRQKADYKTDLLLVCQDVDRLVAMMCFIQLSLLGCAGYIVVGNFLINPLTSPASFLQAEKDCLEVWYTPMFLSPVWQSRIEAEKTKFMEESQ